MVGRYGRPVVVVLALLLAAFPLVVYLWPVAAVVSPAALVLLAGALALIRGVLAALVAIALFTALHWFWLVPAGWARPEWLVALLSAVLVVAVAGRGERSAGLLGSVVNAVRTGIAAVDLHGRQTYVNDALCRMTGFERHELLGRAAPFVYWSPARTPEITAYLRRLTSGDAERDSFETLFRRRGGGDFPVRITVSRIIDARGATTGWSASILDITDQSRLEHDQHRNVAFTAAVLSRLGVFRWRLGPDGAVECHGPADDGLLRRLAAAVAPLVGAADSSGFANCPDIVLDDSAGGRRCFRLLGVPAAVARPDEGFIEERTATWLAEQRSATAVRFEAIARLAGALWHDQIALVNLARAIAGDLGRSVGDDVSRERARQIVAALDRAVAMVRPLMASARQTLPGDASVRSLGAVLESLAALLAAALDKRIDLQVDRPVPDTSVMVPEPDLFRHLLNLVTNACDAMPDGGRLRIGARLTPDGSRVVIDVADSGTGIPPHLRDRIWEPFFSAKPADRGTGLGLPGVLAFARDNGGTVELHSTVGQGTTVTLVLPAAAAAAAAAAAVPAGSVLLIEDDELTSRMLSTVLERAGWRVSRAASLAQAEALLGLGLPDVVLSDLNVGRQSAVDLLRRLSPVQGCKLIVVSGFAAAHDLAGIDATILEKPISVEALLAAIQDGPAAASMAGAVR